VAKGLLRFRVGDRVTIVRGGLCVGSHGHVVRRVVAGDLRQAPPRSIGPDWVVRLDRPAVRSGGTVLAEVWFDDDELESYVVPEHARPKSVGALQHPMRRDG
jgi:hypothetical protein